MIEKKLKYGWTDSEEEYVNSLSSYARAMRKVDWDYINKKEKKKRTGKQIYDDFMEEMDDLFQSS